MMTTVSVQCGGATRECYSCCVCNTYRFDCLFFAIDFHFSIPEKERPPKTYRVVPRMFSGIRAICPECAGGVAGLVAPSIKVEATQ